MSVPENKDGVTGDNVAAAKANTAAGQVHAGGVWVQSVRNQHVLHQNPPSVQARSCPTARRGHKQEVQPDSTVHGSDLWQPGKERMLMISYCSGLKAPNRLKQGGTSAGGHETFICLSLEERHHGYGVRGPWDQVRFSPLGSELGFGLRSPKVSRVSRY